MGKGGRGRGGWEWGWGVVWGGGWSTFCPDKMEKETKLFTFLCFAFVKGDRLREGLLTALTSSLFQPRAGSIILNGA